MGRISLAIRACRLTADRLGKLAFLVLHYRQAAYDAHTCHLTNIEACGSVLRRGPQMQMSQMCTIRGLHDGQTSMLGTALEREKGL